MRIAILDPAAGISGDMTLGALIGAGLDHSWLQALPARAGFPNVVVQIRTVERAAVRAVKVDFDIPESGTHHHGRTVRDLLQIVSAAGVSDAVKVRARQAFELLGVVEGRVHGRAPLDVHLHEVGAVDAVLDIVGAIEGFERLGVDAVYNLPVALGTGWVDAAHGKLPVPAPATLDLLEGFEVTTGSPIVGEATTPTGAVLLRVLSRGAPPVRWRVRGTSWGAGTRDPEHYPGALRLILAEAAAEAGAVEMIATDVDDLSPEYVEPLRRAVFEAGALDCQVWPTQGKKGRVSFRVEALVDSAAADRVSDAMFVHGRTAGVRRSPAWRSTLDRRRLEVELDGVHRVGVKVWDAPGGRRWKAEYEDVVRVAEALGRPASEVAREAESMASARLAEAGDSHGEQA
jgi:uncharacterized protein (TIGR00299 family) protein